MIEQQYYAKKQRGLNNQTDSYDTVAKTPLIKLEFIKKNLHPLCSYDAPCELEMIGETDESKYPPNFIIFPTLTGEMIVGQAVYKNKEFTGICPTFFMHNFILSDNEKRRYVKEPEKLFGITDFAKDCSRIRGRELPTLAGIPYDAEKPYFKDRNKFFLKIGMDDLLFNKLIYATFIAAYSKKRIYIVLDVPIEQLGDLSKALLYHLYQELPWSVTETLGICTYSRKLETKKAMHITFLDCGALDYDNKVYKEFIFDFVNNRYLNIEKDVEIEPYIRIAHRYTHTRSAWEKFNKWADELSITLKNRSDKNITYYNKIAIYFELSVCLKAGRNYDVSNLKMRRTLMKQLLRDIESPISDELKDELIQILEYIITLLYQSILKGSLLTKDEIEGLMHFKLKYCEGDLKQKVHCVQILTDLLETVAHQNNQFYMEMTFQLVRKYPSAYVELYRVLYDRPQLKEKIIDPMIITTLKDIQIVDDFIKRMNTLSIIESVLISDTGYKNQICKCFDKCLSLTENLLELLLKVQDWGKQHTGALYDELVERCEKYFIDHVDLKIINSEDILCELKFKYVHLGENYEVIRIYQRLRKDLSFMSPSKIKINTKVQELIRIYYQKDLCEDNFYMLVYAFLELDKESNEMKPKLNLQKILEYLKDKDKEIMLNFIIWITGQVVYVEKSTFDDQVVAFFMDLRQRQEKIPSKVIKEKLEAQEKTKPLCKKILKAQKYGFLFKSLIHKNYLNE